MIKKMVKRLTSRKMVGGVLRGMGGAVLAGVGWKLGSDVYDAVKKRLSERGGREEAAGEEASEPAEE